MATNDYSTLQQAFQDGEEHFKAYRLRCEEATKEFIRALEQRLAGPPRAVSVVKDVLEQVAYEKKTVLHESAFQIIYTDGVVLRIYSLNLVPSDIPSRLGVKFTVRASIDGDTVRLQAADVSRRWTTDEEQPAAISALVTDFIDTIQRFLDGDRFPATLKAKRSLGFIRTWS